MYSVTCFTNDCKKNQGIIHSNVHKSEQKSNLHYFLYSYTNKAHINVTQKLTFEYKLI